MSKTERFLETKTHLIVFLPAFILLLLIPFALSDVRFIVTILVFLTSFLFIAFHLYYKKRIVISGPKVKIYNWKGKIFEVNYVTDLESIFLADSTIKRQLGLGDLLIKKNDGTFYEYLFISNGRRFLEEVIRLHTKANQRNDPDYKIDVYGVNGK